MQLVPAARIKTAALAVVATAILGFALVSSAEAQTTPGFTAPIPLPSSGIGLAIFDGGTMDELVAAAEAVGATQIYTTVDGGFVGYIIDSQVAVVNADFNARFADGVEAGTPLLLVIG